MRNTNYRRLCVGMAFAAASLVSAASQAQVPTTVPFSGSLSTAAGPVDGNVSVVFRLFNAATNGNEVWTETHNLSAAGGLVLTQLGSAGTPLDAMVFDGTPLWLEIEIDAEIRSPRSAIGAVPYAMRADEASYAEMAGDSDRFGGLLPASFQSRVSQSCPAGSSIRVISDDGKVTCETDNDTVWDVSSTTDGLYVSPGGLLSLSNVDSQHLADNSVGSSEIAAGAVGSSELATSAVRRTALYGVEVALYQQAAGCGGGVTTATSCRTQLCQVINNQVWHLDCFPGICGPRAQQTCSNLTRVGYMLAPDIP